MGFQQGDLVFELKALLFQFGRQRLFSEGPTLSEIGRQLLIGRLPL
jgi:hypothetical protein